MTETEHGANRARTSASSLNFSGGTGWCSTGGGNDDRRSSTRAEPASLLGRRSRRRHLRSRIMKSLLLLDQLKCNIALFPA